MHQFLLCIFHCVNTNNLLIQLVDTVCIQIVTKNAPTNICVYYSVCTCMKISAECISESKIVKSMHIFVGYCLFYYVTELLFHFTL